MYHGNVVELRFKIHLENIENLRFIIIIYSILHVFC